MLMKFGRGGKGNPWPPRLAPVALIAHLFVHSCPKSPSEVPWLPQLRKPPVTLIIAVDPNSLALNLLFSADPEKGVGSSVPATLFRSSDVSHFSVVYNAGARHGIDGTHDALAD
jgi:hypothetical protein